MKYILTICGLFLFAGTAEATFYKPHNEYGKLKVSECVQTKCGNEAGKITYTIPCNSVNSWGINICKEDKVWTKECTVKEPVACEEEGICPTECGLEASEVADGQGGTKICEATPACEIPVKKVEQSRADLDYTQGEDGIIGDGKVKLKWDNFKDCSKVKIKIATDGVFGNGYTSFETKDDGSEWIDMDNVFWAKIRCTKDGSRYSETEKITP